VLDCIGLFIKEMYVVTECEFAVCQHRRKAVVKTIQIQIHSVLWKCLVVVSLCGVG
jgi:hypothetical protein